MRTVGAVLFVGVSSLLLGVYLLPDKWGYGLLGFSAAHFVLGGLIGFREKGRTPG